MVCHYAFKRAQHDNKAINAMAGRAEKVASGERPPKKDRFVAFTDTSTRVNWDLVERARSLAGIKGYVTNIDPAVMDGPAVVAAYHDLYQVERSFRMTNSDLAARAVFHRLEDSIQAHLTIVFAALAVSREAQARAGLSINRVLKLLRPPPGGDPALTVGPDDSAGMPVGDIRGDARHGEHGRRRGQADGAVDAACHGYGRVIIAQWAAGGAEPVAECFGKLILLVGSAYRTGIGPGGTGIGHGLLLHDRLGGIWEVASGVNALNLSQSS